MLSDNIHERIRRYILQNLVFDENMDIGYDQSLLRSGIVDSTGIFDIIAFVEDEFDVRFDDAELIADNFDTINRVTACVTRKLLSNSPRIRS